LVNGGELTQSDYTADNIKALLAVVDTNLVGGGRTGEVEPVDRRKVVSRPSDRRHGDAGGGLVQTIVGKPFDQARYGARIIADAAETEGYVAGLAGAASKAAAKVRAAMWRKIMS
jgi:hypothetical protein